MKKHNEYLQFVEWCSLPSALRKPKDQKKLAKELGVDETTLSNWKKRDDFWDLVRVNIKGWAKGKTPEVIQSIFIGATMNGEAGQAANAKLWLQWVDEWAEKSDVSIYDAEREKKAKSLLEVYDKFDNEKHKSKTTAKSSRSKRGSNKRSTKTTKSKSKSGNTKAKRSN